MVSYVAGVGQGLAEGEVQMRLWGKVVVLTGAGSGMGRQLARQLLERGAQVAAVDIRRESLEETAALFDAGPRMSLHELDITDRDAARALPDTVVSQHGTVDGLINDAGIIQPFVRVADLDDATIDRIMAVNFFGMLNLTRAFLPSLTARPEAHLVNVSSMGGFLPVPGQAVYGASKAAVKLLTEALHGELYDTKVHVSVVLPGAVETDIARNSGVAIPSMDASSTRMTAAPDAARTILDGVESDKLYIFVGRDSKLMNAATRLAPRRATQLIRNQMKGLLTRENT